MRAGRAGSRRGTMRLSGGLRVISLALCVLILMGGCADAAEKYEIQPVDGYYSKQNGGFQWSGGAPGNLPSQAFRFAAPPEAISMKLEARQWTDGTWEPLLDGGISIGEEREPVSQLAGKLYIEPEGDAIRVVIDCSGTVEYTVKPETSFQEQSWDVRFFDTPREIKLNEEFPLCVVSGDDSSGEREIALLAEQDRSGLPVQETPVVVSVTFFDSELRCDAKENMAAE